MGFFEEVAEREAREALGSGSQNDTTGQCAFCGLAGDDVLIGVCADCGAGDFDRRLAIR
jgi:hypothetical protein